MFETKYSTEIKSHCPDVRLEKVQTYFENMYITELKSQCPDVRLKNIQTYV